MSEVRKITDIHVPNRHRRDMGDLRTLAASIKERLIHPVAIRADGLLVSGQRRLEAARLLGWETIPIHIVENVADAIALLQAERDENVCRLDFAPSEAVAVGQKLEGMQRKPGRPKGGKLPPLSRTGKTRDNVAAAVGMSGKTYEKAKAVVESGDAALIELMDRKNVEQAYKKMKRDEREVALAVAQQDFNLPGLTAAFDLRVCSCAELFASGIRPDIVVTDPPYAREFLPVFTELAESCKAAAVPLVAVMSGQSYLPEVIRRLCEHLVYRWTLAYLTPGGQAAQQWQAKVNTFWKPVLLFGQAEEWIGDVTRSRVNDNDKRFHDWGQSESGMADLVERITKPGQLVCDPCAGAGTTAVVSLALGRRFVGCDIDPDCVAKARRRVEQQCKK